MLLRIACIVSFAGLAFAQLPARPKLNNLEIRKAHDIQVEINRQQTIADGQAKAYAHLPEKLTPGGLPIKAPTLLKAKIEADQKITGTRLAQLQAQFSDWESKVLAAHKGDPKRHKIDWVAGAIVAK